MISPLALLSYEADPQGFTPQVFCMEFHFFGSFSRCYCFAMGTNSGPTLEKPTGHPSPSAAAPKKNGIGRWIWVLFLCVAGAAGYRYYPQVTQGASKGEKGGERAAPKKAGQVVPIVAAASRRGDLSIFLTGLGSVTA